MHPGSTSLLQRARSCSILGRRGRRPWLSGIMRPCQGRVGSSILPGRTTRRSKKRTRTACVFCFSHGDKLGDMCIKDKLVHAVFSENGSVEALYKIHHLFHIEHVPRETCSMWNPVQRAEHLSGGLLKDHECTAYRPRKEGGASGGEPSYPEGYVLRETN